MAKRWTQTGAFEYFKTVRKNPRWSWSARSEDGKVVAVTLWQDEFQDGGRIYRSRGITSNRNQAGRTELLENLRWAVDHCNGEIRVVMAVAEDIKADPRSIASCFPHPSLRMKVIELDQEKRHFVLQRIE